MCQISRQSIKARVSYSNFKKCCKKKKKENNNTKKIRLILKAHIGGTACSSNLKLKLPHPEGIHTENCVRFSSGNVELPMHENGFFFTLVKYTLVYRAPQVSWATRHTTVCLDFSVFFVFCIGLRAGADHFFFFIVTLIGLSSAGVCVVFCIGAVIGVFTVAQNLYSLVFTFSLVRYTCAVQV